MTKSYKNGLSLKCIPNLGHDKSQPLRDLPKGLSRGCSAENIVGVVAITAFQDQMAE